MFNILNKYKVMDDIIALPHINKLQAYVPGKPIETLAREKNISNIIKLASNENPYGPSPKVYEILAEKIKSLNLYPDPDQYLLKQEISKFYNISNNMVAIGNGSDEIFQLIMRAFADQTNNIIFPKYSFSSYQICADAVGAKSIIAEIDSNWQSNLHNILKLINNKTKIICLANPNNPTGTYLNIEDISSFISKIPEHIIVLLDEAYFEYVKYSSPISSDYVDKSIALVQKYENLIITRTFSKAYGLAGLRVGYSISSPHIAAIINKLKQPFNVNRLAQYAGIAALQDQNYVQQAIALNNKEKNYLYNEFDKLGIKYIPTHANFITINTKTSLLIYNYLLDNGIIVRPINNYGLDDYLRISIGSHEENKALVISLNCYNKSV